ncbi:uncharacterized protein Rab32 isoform X1 [Eurosta solidaginis]|uniref:uncharacterized protein Rab32 isoform X1 n=2 Tax=Eurosta solidaginis TaxID=178769 RepID=UPI003530E18A
MQNVESQTEIRTDDENLDLEKIGSTELLDSALARTASTTTTTDTTSTTGKSKTSNPECVQSDPETRRKSKTRSRFTSALRKLSGRKKRPLSKDDSTENSIARGPYAEIVSAPETVISSGGEEETGDINAANITPETKPKKKSKLARRFLLGSLKKPKSGAIKKSIDEDDEVDNVIEQGGNQDETTVEDVGTNTTTDKVVGSPRTKRLVKITLSETQQKTVHELEEDADKQLIDVTAAVVAGASTETDYLPPIAAKVQSSVKEATGDEDDELSPATSASRAATSTKKKRLKTKKSALKEAAVTIIKTTATSGNNGGTVSAAPGTQKQPTAIAQKSSTTRTTTITTDEKFVITHNTRDTPPRERAPAKPGRVNARLPLENLTTPPASTGAIRKTNTRTAPSAVAATITTDHSVGREQRTRFGAVSIAAAVAGKRQRNSSAKSSTKSASSKSVANPTATTTTTAVKVVETELMQRGHRYPKPTTTTIKAPITIIANAEGTTSATSTQQLQANPSSNGTSIVANPQTRSEISSNVDTLTTLIDKNLKKPTNSASITPSDSTTKTVTESAIASEAIETQIQFQLDSHAASNNQAHKKTQSPQQQQSVLAPQILVNDDTALSATQSTETIQSNAVLSDYQEISTSSLATTETRSSHIAHFRHPSSSKVIYPDPGIYNDDEINTSLRNKSETSLYIADELVTTASSSGADEVVSSAESAQPSDFSGNNIRDLNLLGSALRKEDLEQARGPPLQPTVHFAVGSVVRPQPQVNSFDSSLHENSSYDSGPNSGDSHSESSRRRIRYIAQPDTFDEDFDSIQKRQGNNRAKASKYSVNSEYDSGDNQMPAFGDLTMEQEMEPTIMTSANTEKREHLYKILVIGELGTGKTSFIKRYVHQFFSQNYRATIGVDFALKVLHWDPNTTVRLQLWDIAGQERFGNMTRVYYKEAVGAFIVFDVTRSGTFDCVSKWKEDLDSKVQLPDGNPIPCILLANKCDQEKQGIVTSPEKMDAYVRENGFAGWYETSAKENINIDEAARALVNKILLNDKLISAADLADSEKFNLSNSMDQTTSEGKSKCSC